MNPLVQLVKDIADERLSIEVRAGFLHLLDIVVKSQQLSGFPEDNPESLYGSVISLLKFGDKRPRGKALVACFNPTIDVEGWESDHTVIQLINDDMPFLMDSIVNLLTEKSISIHSILHPVTTVLRDEKGVRTRFLDAGNDKSTNESSILIQIDRRGSDEECQSLQAEIEEMFAGIRAIVEDWRQMLDRIGETSASLKQLAPISSEDKTEVTDFIDWICDEHFIFLGCRQYSCTSDGADIIAESGLGLMRAPDFTVLKDADGNFAYWTDEMETFITEESAILILKANRKTDIHRSAHYDFIGIKRYDKNGKVIGKDVYIGLFSSAAYNRNALRIPLLRQKVKQVHELAGFQPRSHDDKALANVLETYPRDELFQISTDELLSNAVGIMQLITRPRPSVFVRADRFNRFVSCLTYIPRENYTTELRKKIGDILSEALDGRVAEFTPFFGEGALVRIHFVVAANSKSIADFEIDKIKERIRQIVRGWSNELKEELVHRAGEADGNTLFAKYQAGFPSDYRNEFSTATAAADIEKLEQVSKETPLSLKFYHRIVDPSNAVRFKLFNDQDPLPLSDCLPVLEGMGLRVIEEHPFKIRRAGALIWIHDFYMQTTDGQDIDLGKLRQRLEDGFTAVWFGKVDNDPLNSQILRSGLTIRQIVLLRAYSRYLRQAKLSFSQNFVENAINQNPDVARALVQMFEAAFDPANGFDEAKRKAECERLSAQIETALEQVASLQVDQILRRFKNAIESTLRTNYFQPDEHGNAKDYISFKFRSSQLEGLPLPRPWREIFVYSTWVEGVHLRFGPIARGGLRWSDRSEDYRTEVLGLVKAQQVKNAVIVPVGSKGGFLPKRLPENATRDETVAEAIRCYKTYLSGLLDITDNLVNDEIVAPKGVIRVDADDPYLVVAADKGTATFSDIANAVADDYNFWLGDAFASGGSNGYDHKGMGITARGAWEAVKRHFRELGLDTQTEPFSVIGVGDMSGDVFGNGMLLSEKIRLIAAFDHRDIFIDPDPDTAKSFTERQRLFETPRCTWQDYNAELISKGGGIFSRSAKSVKLTPEIKAITGLKANKVTPAELINALLKSPVDMLWFGGIGSYIKATSESHADAGDRANDLIRVDAPEVQARVIGEGANLGITQNGRVEMAANGVKLNTDAVDNSAGVDCSDHEVNIKIAVGAVVAAGDMTVKQRNTLLASMTDNIADLVLRTNYGQTLAISMVEARAPELVEEHMQLMQAFEDRKLLNRKVEYLPNNDKLWERKEAGNGLTRPEICVLLSYAKNIAFADMLRTTLPDDPYFQATLLNYMPDAIKARFKETILAHRLKREIVATILANELIDKTGPSFFVNLSKQTGAEIDRVTSAFYVVQEVYGLAGLTDEINRLDNILPAAAQTDMHLRLMEFTKKQCARLVAKGSLGEITASVETYRAGAKALQEGVSELLPEFLSGQRVILLDELLAAGAPDELAEKISQLSFLQDSFDIIDDSRASNRSAIEMAHVHFNAGARFGLDRLRNQAQELQSSDRWERALLDRLFGELRDHQKAISALLTSDNCTTETDGSISLSGAVAQLSEAVDTLFDELNSSGELTLAKLAVVSSKLRTMIEAMPEQG